MVVLVAVGAAIVCLNDVFPLAAVRVVIGEKINTLVTIPSAVAEISMVFCLLIVGVKQKAGPIIKNPA